jgi:amino acid transporter
MLIDKKILAGGIALLVVGFTLTAAFTTTSPVGRGGMTDDEIAAFLIEEQENQDYTTLAGIMIGVGFLLILISFGARRKKKGGAKRTEKKPAS